MNIHQKTNATMYVVCATLSILVLSSGCRTGGFSKPDMGKFAFWKPENLMFASQKENVPPPPARHFDPAPINGEKKATSQVVDLNPRQIKKRFDNDINEMRAEISATAEAVGSPSRESSDPSSPLDANQFVADTKSSFASTANEVRSQVNQLESRANNELTAAQNEFQKAMQNTTNSFDAGLAATTNAAADLTQSWNDSTTPSGLAPAKINQSLAGVNQSLQAATDKLTSSLQSDADSAFKTGISEFGGSLKPLGKQATDQVNQFADNTKQNVSNFAEHANSYLPSTPSNRQVSAQSPGQQDELSEARRQIEELKQQLAAGKPADASTQSFTPPSAPAGNDSQGFSPQSGPVDHIAQANPSGFGSRYSAGSSSDPKPVAPLTNPSLEPSNQGFSNPSYPSTAHNGFAAQPSQFGGNFSPSPMTEPGNGTTGNAATVGFQTTTDDSSNVVTADHAASSEAGNSASRIQSHAADVDLPESILKRSGGYAPGSLQPLKPIR